LRKRESEISSVSIKLAKISKTSPNKMNMSGKRLRISYLVRVRSSL
jgi:hypothetical protein